MAKAKYSQEQIDKYRRYDMFGLLEKLDTSASKPFISKSEERVDEQGNLVLSDKTGQPLKDALFTERKLLDNGQPDPAWTEENAEWVTASDIKSLVIPTVIYRSAKLSEHGYKRTYRWYKEDYVGNETVELICNLLRGKFKAIKIKMMADDLCKLMSSKAADVYMTDGLINNVLNDTALAVKQGGEMLKGNKPEEDTLTVY